MRRLLGDLQQPAYGLDGGLAILLGGEVAVQDVRLGARQQRAQEHLAAAGGAQQAGAEHVGVVHGQSEPLVDEHHRGRVDLEIRPLQAIAGSEEAAGLADVGGQRAAAFVQQGDVLLGLRRHECLGVGQVPEADVRVVLQVLADRQVDARHDAVRLELGADPDPRQHQDLRGVVGAGGEDDLALGVQLGELVAALDLHADGAPAVEQDPRAQRFGDHREVLARLPQRGAQVGHGGAATHSVALGELVVADAVLLGAIEVVVARVPGLLGGLEEGVHERMPGAPIADGERTPDAVQLAGAALVVLGTQEVGQHRVPSPPLRAERFPLVVVGTVAAHVDHGVHRRGAAQHLAARQIPAAAVQAGLRVGQVVPVLMPASPVRTQM